MGDQNGIGNEMIRIVGAVLAGYVAIGVLVVLTDQIFAVAVPGFRATIPPPLYYFVIVTITDALYSIAGGYLCAVIARAAVRKATLSLMIFGEIMGVASTILQWHAEPHWAAIALLVLYPIAVWIGSKLRSGNNQQAMASAAAAASK
jgi:hypothetical protein